MRARHTLLIICGLFLMLLCGCGDKTGTVMLPTVSDITETGDEDTSVTDNGTEYHEEDITGIERYEFGKYPNISNDVSMTGILYDYASVGGRLIRDIEISEVNGNLLISYKLISNDDENENEDEDEDSGIFDYDGNEYEYHLALVDKSSLSVIKDTVIYGTYSYSYHNDKGIWYFDSGYNGIKGCLYDENTELTETMILDNVRMMYYSDDNEYGYYFQDNRVYSYDIYSHMTNEVDFKEKFICTDLIDVFTDANGTDYIVVSGVFQDMNSYYGAYSMGIDEFVYLKSYEDGYPPIADKQNGSVIVRGLENNDGLVWQLYESSRQALEFIWPYVDEDIYLSVLGDGNVFCCRIQSDTVECVIFDRSTHLAIANTNFTVSSEYGSGGSIFNLPVFEPVRLSDGSILMGFYDEYLTMYYYKWQPESSNGDWDVMSVVPIDDTTSEIVPIDNLYDTDELIKGEVSEELRPLLEKVSYIEERYGLKVNIGRECAGIYGGYAVFPVEDYNIVEQSLNTLETELLKYPDGFIDLFKRDGYDTISIYLSGQLVGVCDGTVYACGFQSEIGSEIYMVVDCYQTFASTFHHELCHIIDDYLEEKGSISTTVWNGFNPADENYEDVYTYDYSMFGYDDCFIYTYNYEGNNDNCYFVDSYSMTYPSEDRARIWEKVMAADDEGFDIETAPHLKDKFIYFTECIKNTFDTSTWGEVYWEYEQ